MDFIHEGYKVTTENIQASSLLIAWTEVIQSAWKHGHIQPPPWLRELWWSALAINADGLVPHSF